MKVHERAYRSQYPNRGIWSITKERYLLNRMIHKPKGIRGFYKRDHVYKN